MDLFLPRCQRFFLTTFFTFWIGLPAATCRADYLDISFEGKTILSEHDVESAEASDAEKSNRSQISLKLDANSTRAFAKLTEANVGKKIALKLRDKTIESVPIRAKIDTGRWMLPGFYSRKEAKQIAEEFNSLVREEGLISANGQTLFQYYGSVRGHTFRIVKMPTKDFDTFPEVLDHRAISVSQKQQFVYNSDVTCSYDGDPAFAVINKKDLSETKAFHPAQAWIVEVIKNKIVFPPVNKVECFSHAS